MTVTESREKESRKHRLSDGCPRRDSAEHEGETGALSESRIIENNITNAGRPEDRMLEEILSPRNLNLACKRVKKNKGAGEVDGMSVEDLLQYLKDNGEELRRFSRSYSLK
jgi:hypothetical protein